MEASSEQRQAGEDVRHVIDTLGDLDDVSRTGIGKMLSQENMGSGDLKRVWGA